MAHRSILAILLLAITPLIFLPQACLNFDDMLYVAVTETDFDDRTFGKINRYRESQDLHELAYSPDLHRLAQEQADSMHARAELDHEGFESRMARSGSSYCVENCAAGGSTSSSVLDMWKHSAGHNDNLLNKTVFFGAVAHSGAYSVFFACH
jgi:uncharacterized protein YkwD